MLFEKIRTYCCKGYYRERHILALHKAGVLTDTQKEELLALLV